MYTTVRGEYTVKGSLLPRYFTPVLSRDSLYLYSRQNNENNKHWHRQPVSQPQGSYDYAMSRCSDVSVEAALLCL